MKNTISENYFGSEAEPLDIIESKYGKIYVLRDEDDDIRFYDENGDDPLNLSYIDVSEFNKIFEEKNELRN